MVKTVCNPLRGKFARCCTLSGNSNSHAMPRLSGKWCSRRQKLDTAAEPQTKDVLTVCDNESAQFDVFLAL